MSPQHANPSDFGPAGFSFVGPHAATPLGARASKRAESEPWRAVAGCGAAGNFSQTNKTHKAQQSALQALKIGYNGVLLLLNFERFFSKTVAALAQSVEHWIVIPGVTGSIPVCRPKFKNPRKVRLAGVFTFGFGTFGFGF